MAKEIERKFLVRSGGWKPFVESTMTIRQAYLSTTGRMTVRVRIVDERHAVLTIKTRRDRGARDEFEYPIPMQDAEEMISHCIGHVICKRRNLVYAASYIWEIDEFEGRHAGLIIAEIELPFASTRFSKPDWLGMEVTNDLRYCNSRLAGHSIFRKSLECLQRPFRRKLSPPEYGQGNGETLPALAGLDHESRANREGLDFA